MCILVCGMPRAASTLALLIWYGPGMLGAILIYFCQAMIRTGAPAMTVPWYYKYMKDVVIQLNSMFTAGFPDKYEEYVAITQAGNFYPQDVSAWLGWAIIHKLQVEVPHDRLDPSEKPVASFLSGRYVGGEMYYSDLGLRFW